MRIALLTNEIPPIVYGGVATWILNFLDMFKNDPDIEVIPVFLAHLDEPPTDFPERYPGIRIIHGSKDIEEMFQDIDITVNINIDITININIDINITTYIIININIHININNIII